MYLSAANGEPNEMVAETLQLGIHLLSGGNKDIQKVINSLPTLFELSDEFFCLELVCRDYILNLDYSQLHNFSDDAKLFTNSKRCPFLHFSIRINVQM